MAISLPDLTPEGKKYFDELNKLINLEVHVGFQEGAVYDDGASLAQVAAYNEFGSSDTPARPFMRQSFENHEAELRQACAAVNNKILRGESAENAMKTLGAFAVGVVQMEIMDGDFEPNKPSTIKRKGSDRPLIDTGHMRQSVKYVVKERGE